MLNNEVGYCKKGVMEVSFCFLQACPPISPISSIKVRPRGWGGRSWFQDKPQDAAAPRSRRGPSPTKGGERRPLPSPSPTAPSPQPRGPAPRPRRGRSGPGARGDVAAQPRLPARVCDVTVPAPAPLTSPCPAAAPPPPGAPLPPPGAVSRAPTAPGGAGAAAAAPPALPSPPVPPLGPGPPVLPRPPPRLFFRRFAPRLASAGLMVLTPGHGRRERRGEKEVGGRGAGSRQAPGTGEAGRGRSSPGGAGEAGLSRPRGLARPRRRWAELPSNMADTRGKWSPFTLGGSPSALTGTGRARHAGRRSSAPRR